MNIESYRNHCIEKKGATESFPFPKLPNILVFKVADKMFTATDVNSFSSISVKCKSENVDELRSRYPAVIKPSYFSERHWNWIIMDNTIPDKVILKWIDDSYNLIISKLTKKVRTDLNL